MAGKPIKHGRFNRVIDPQYIDTEDAPLDYLEDCKNMTLFRKLGSIKQVAGFSILKTHANMPDKANYVLDDYELIDEYVFGLDKDQKEIYILVYKDSNTDEIRLFIGPWFNPAANFSNYSSRAGYTENAWQTTWLELTERYDTQVQVGGVNTVTFTTGTNPIADVSNHLNGFFIVNTSRSSADGSYKDNRFNYITAHSYAAGTHTLTLKGDITGLGVNWANNDYVVIVRFPVSYLYNANADGYSGIGDTFKGQPTQFKYKENQLRMPCGKDNRPLILEFIQNRKYFLGKEQEAMSYEGFWFDFQTPPQVMRNSAITGFASRSGGTAGLTDYDINNPLAPGAPPTSWTTRATAFVTISRQTGSGELGLSVGSLTAHNNVHVIIPNVCVYYPEWNILTFATGIAGTLSAANFIAAFNKTTNPLYPTFKATASVGGNLTTTTATINHFKTFISTSTGLFSGKEAAGNQTAENLFIGASVYAYDDAELESHQRNLHILNLIYDNRSQMLLSHGTFSAKVDSYGLQVRFGLWFSRRLTGMSLFNQKLEDTAGIGVENTYIVNQEKYPFFIYVKEMGATEKLRINELKHFAQYDLYDFSRAPNGELVSGLQAATNSGTAGINCYTYDTTKAWWYTYFRAGYNGIATSGTGLRYIAKCNRYIDQDNTMNYTRCEFLGQTNGRFFLIGVKNSVERVLFESNDISVYNIYANVVSEYDTFLRDRYMPVAFGDKDQLVAIENFNGYMFLAKETNSYALEVNTDNEVKYRTIDTHLGRGVANPEILIQTPHGLVMPTSDGVWLVSQNGSERILTETNGKLNLYKSIFPDIQSCIYYNKYDELLIMFNNSFGDVPTTVNTYILVYSFTTKTWGGYYYLTGASASVNNCRPRKFRTNTTNDVIMINWGNIDNYNIIYIDEAISTFANTDGSTQTIIFEVVFPHVSYTNREVDYLVQKIKLNYDINAGAARNITFTLAREGLSDESQTLAVSPGSLTASNKSVETLGKYGGISDLTQLKITNPSNFTDFAINSIIVWIAPQGRHKLPT